MPWNTTLDKLVPGIFGVSHGSGKVGELIRTATQSWAGHAFMYIGDGRIIEGTPPVARINMAVAYDDIRWAYKMPLTQDQQVAVVARAHALVGVSYDFEAYIGFGLEVLDLRNAIQMQSWFKSDQQRVCSALVDDCYQTAKVTLDWSAIHMKPGMAPNLVSPAMLDDLADAKDWK
jgi:uncharacterized protein YycO